MVLNNHIAEHHLNNLFFLPETQFGFLWNKIGSMKKVFHAIANFYWPFISLFFFVISLNNYKILILSNPKIYFFLDRSYSEILLPGSPWDLIQDWLQ